MRSGGGLARASVLASLLAAACGGPPSARQIRSTAETAASWAASARWSVEAWSENRVTGRFLRTMLEQARQALDREARDLRGKPSPPAVDLRRTTGLLERESGLAAAIAADVQKDDARQARAHASELATVERELRSLSAALGS